MSWSRCCEWLGSFGVTGDARFSGSQPISTVAGEVDKSKAMGREKHACEDRDEGLTKRL